MVWKHTRMTKPYPFWKDDTSCFPVADRRSLPATVFISDSTEWWALKALCIWLACSKPMHPLFFMESIGGHCKMLHAFFPIFFRWKMPWFLSSQVLGGLIQVDALPTSPTCISLSSGFIIYIPAVYIIIMQWLPRDEGILLPSRFSSISHIWTLDCIRSLCGKFVGAREHIIQ